MWRITIPIALLCTSLHSNDVSRSISFGIKPVAALNKHQRQRQEENNRGRRNQNQGNNNYNQQNPWGNFGGDSFGGAGGVANTALYDALNVAPDATDKDIKSSYRKLALEVSLLCIQTTLILFSMSSQ